MTPAEKEQLQAMYARYNYQCYVCGERAKMRAHIIGDTKPNRRRYGNAIVDNPLDWLPSCTLHCNSLIDISNNPEARDKIVSIIRIDAPDYLKRKDIEKIVDGNILRKRNKRA